MTIAQTAKRWRLWWYNRKTDRMERGVAQYASRQEAERVREWAERDWGTVYIIQVGDDDGGSDESE